MSAIHALPERDAPDRAAGGVGRPPMTDATAASVRMILGDVRRRLGMDVALVSHFADGERVIDIVDAGGPVAFGPGDSEPVEETYCQRIVDGRLPEVIPDAGANTEARRLPVTRELGIGAHVGVPIVLDNGEVFGTLCTYAHGARPDLDERAGTVLGLVADTIGRILAAEHGAWRAREGVRQRLDALLSGSLLTMAYQPAFSQYFRQIVRPSMNGGGRTYIRAHWGGPPLRPRPRSGRFGR